MQRRYTESIAANMAQEPGGAIAYFGFLALPVWYFFSGWAADFSSRGAGEAVFHLILIGVAVLAAVIWAGASLTEIEEFGHTGRLLTSVLWWYLLFYYAKNNSLEGWGLFWFFAGLVLFEVPLNIIERIACMYRGAGKCIKVFYQYGSLAVMCLMLSATLTSGFSAFFEFSSFARILNSAYDMIQAVIILGWWADE